MTVKSNCDIYSHFKSSKKYASKGDELEILPNQVLLVKNKDGEAFPTKAKNLNIIKNAECKN